MMTKKICSGHGFKEQLRIRRRSCCGEEVLRPKKKELLRSMVTTTRRLRGQPTRTAAKSMTISDLDKELLRWKKISTLPSLRSKTTGS